jgi:uncharacterized membrane protein
MGIIWIIISTTLGATGQILMKKGMMHIGKLPDKSPLGKAILYYLKAVFSPLVFSGLACYGISMIIWLWVLSRYELSYARPFVATGYIIVALYSFFFMGENVGIIRWIGIGLIVIGVILVAKS